MRWFGTSTEIDALKCAEKRMRESEARLRLALDAAQMGIWDWEVQTGRLLWSPGNLRLFGYEEGEFNNNYEGFRRRVHPDDIDEIERQVAANLDNGHTFRREFRVVWPDGGIHWIEVVGGVVDRIDGQATRMIGTAVDITARKRTEEELERRA